MLEWEEQEDSSQGDAALAPYVPDPQTLAEVAAELREIERRTGVDRVVEIGRVVLTRFFGGSAEVWSERRRNKNNSIRRIAAHPECPLSRSALNEAVAVYVALQALPGVRTSGHISASHVAVVTFLDTERQREWLERAEEHAWSVRELKECVRAERRESGERRGRPRAAPPRQIVSGLRSAIARLRRATDALADQELGPEDELELATLADEIAALQHQIRERPSTPLVRSPSQSGMMAKVDVGSATSERRKPLGTS